MALNLKEFLRPDWRKTSLTIVLSVLSLSISFLFSGHLEELPLWLKVFIFPYLFFREIYLQSMFDFLNWLIFPLAIWYLFSCIILSLYDKFRKKS